MSQLTISTELVRRLRHQPPAEVTDYRDPKLPGFVLRARPSGIHSWRVQLPSRRWLTLGRMEEVALGDAREAAQKRRAQAALGQDIPTRKPTSEVTLRTFLDETYEPWMIATYGKRTTQVSMIRGAFRDLLDLRLSELTTGRIDRWRATRKFRHAGADAPAKIRARQISRATINHNLLGLRAALNRATEWGVLSAMPLGKIKRRAEDENAVVRYLTDEEETHLRAALGARDKRRRAGRNSSNAWRRERGYRQWASFGTYTDHLTPLVLLGLNTGLRRGELLHLHWRDVDLRRAASTVMRAWQPAAFDGDSFVFGSLESKPLVAIKKSWGTVLSAAKIKHFRFHDLRHTFASKLVMAGVDLNTVRELLGHKSLAVTLRYAHLAPEQKAAAVEALVAKAQRGKGQHGKAA